MSNSAMFPDTRLNKRIKSFAVVTGRAPDHCAKKHQQINNRETGLQTICTGDAWKEEKGKNSEK